MEGEAITADVAAALVASQFPEWDDLPISPVALPGWDNITFRLGDELSVRLPRDAAHAPQVAKEHQWLPFLAPGLPVPIPEPVALGAKHELFPRHWSVYRWLEGESAAHAALDDETTFAREVGRFLKALRQIDAAEGPPAGSHSFHRGGSLTRYDTQSRSAIAVLTNGSSAAALTDVWDAAVATEWTHPPVWVHGDMTASNLLVTDGSLSAVIDFGCCAVGDPACDLVMTWTFFSGKARVAFRHEVDLDPATWARARGWALWKALITLADDHLKHSDAELAASRFGWRFGAGEVLDLVVEDHYNAKR